MIFGELFPSESFTRRRRMQSFSLMEILAHRMLSSGAVQGGQKAFPEKGEAIQSLALSSQNPVADVEGVALEAEVVRSRLHLEILIYFSFNC